MGLLCFARARGLALAAPFALGTVLAPAEGAAVAPPAEPAPVSASAGAVEPAPLLGPDAPDPLLDEDADLFDDEALAPDPWEGVNREIFSFNRALDRFVLDPVTDVYQFLVPEPGRHALHRAFLNLDAPVVFANQLLQLRFDAAAVTLGRFVVNSTAGVGGLFDAASRGAGIEPIDADFGQTLARYGTPSGPYVMLPLFGPSTVRDTVGGAVDAAGDPLTYLIGPFQWWTLILDTGQGIVIREAHVGDLRALEEGSIDFYSALRSAYLQAREARVQEAAADPPLEVVVQRQE